MAVPASERRTSKRTSSSSKESPRDSRKGNRNRSRKNAPEREKKNHLHHLRNITTKLLREDSEIRTTASSVIGTNYPKNRHRCKPKGNDSTTRLPRERFILKPWVESSSKLWGSKPWVEAEASPIDIVAVQQQQDKQASDSVTEHTALCSAFEMLSLEYFCSGGGPKHSPRPSIADAFAAQPIKVVGHSPAVDDGFVVPREITFSNPGICGCAEIPVGKNQKLESKSPKKHGQHHNFMKRLLPFMPSKAEKNNSSDTRVMKVKVFVDAPKQNHSGSNFSIGNSTLTMPKELQRGISNSNTTI